MQTIRKILIANRGEIALRIQRAAKAMGIHTVALYSTGEEEAAHVAGADETVFIGTGPLGQTYLNIERIIDAAKTTSSDAIHPGYGFLSENPYLAEACQQNGIIWIGPSAETLKLMGNKLEAKIHAQKLGIPVLNDQPVFIDNLEKTATSLPYPVLIKSSFGGGGKGMQVAQSPSEMIEKAIQTSRMALSYFGNGDVYTEPYIPKARHIEVQIIGDSFGNLVHLYERDCTLQRNYQKIIEEAPASGLSEIQRETILESALKIGKSVGYTGAGTVEFLLDDTGRYYFMEMNPRIQVEHPVTEEITGIDIVREQIRIASGMPISFHQDEIKVKGHSVEVRLYTEDPWKGFIPSTNPVSFFNLPQGENIRIETDLISKTNGTVSQFDPLLCKIITWGADRREAMQLMVKALEETVIAGPSTNQRYLHALLTHPSVEAGNVSTRFCEDSIDGLLVQAENFRNNVPVKFLVASYLYLKFMPVDHTSKNPWISQGFSNLQHEVEISVDGSMIKVPFRITRIQENRKDHKKSFTFSLFGEETKAFAVSLKENFLQITIGQKTETIHWENDQELQSRLFLKANSFVLNSADLLECYPKANGTKNGLEVHGFHVRSPLHGKVIDIKVQPGQVITKGDLLLVIEAMKSENHIIAHSSGRIKSIEVSVGTQVNDQMTLIVLDDH